MGDTSLLKFGPVRSATIFIAVQLMITSLFLMIGTDDTDAISFSSDYIEGDVTWTLSDSPVRVEGNLTIREGASLTIQPGVLVTFPEGTFLQVNGSLEIQGTDPAPVTIQGSGDDIFDRINITSGGQANITHCVMNSDRGIHAAGAGAGARIHNSTITSRMYGFTSGSGAESWLINCTFNSVSNVSVGGGIVHEGNWFRFLALKDNGEGPYTDGADLKIYASNPQGSSWYIYDSTSGDPRTGSDGRLDPIAIDQYLHEGSNSVNRVKITLTMDAENSRWRLQENEWEILGDTDYIWFLDFTPPVPPSNLTVIGKGGHYIHISWDFDGDDTRLAYFVIDYKKYWESDSDWDRVEPSPSVREWNITVEDPPNALGLLEEMEYDIRIFCIDGSDNPSPMVGPIAVKTLDITNPLPPEDLILTHIDGTYANLQWNRSADIDITDYGIILDGGEFDHELIRIPSDGNTTQTFNITGLESETEYSIAMTAFDDGEIENNSTLTERLDFKTLDITSPPKPSLVLEFLEPYQFVNGSGYYNGTQVALQGSVNGENRTFIDVFVGGELYVNPNPDLPRPSSYQGDFFFFITLDEGEYEIKVRSVDPAGNEGPFSDTVSVTIDRTDPVIGIEIPEDGIIYADNDRMTEIDSNSTDENSVHTVKWNLEGPGGLESEETGAVLSDIFSEGEWNVTLTVIDPAGNRNITHFKIVSRVPDNVIPVATLVKPGSPVDVDHAPIFEVSFSEEINWDLLDSGVIRKDGTGSIDLIMDVDGENLSVVFELTDSLEGGKNYTFSLSMIRDLRGNRGSDLEFDFRTIDDNRVDSDNDGIPDFYEVQKSFLSPSNPLDAEEDEDGDGLTNKGEYDENTNPEEPDSDGDGMTDGWEVKYGFHPNDRSDALVDSDGDTYSNLEEFRAETDPKDRDDKPSASEENDSLLLFVIIGAVILVVMVIAAAVIMMARARKKGEEEEEADDEGEQEQDAPATWSEQEKVSSSECPSCGATLEAGMDYCPECGATIEISGDEDITEGSMDEESMEEEGGGSEPVMDSVPADPESMEMDEDIPGMEDDIGMNEPPRM